MSIRLTDLARMDEAQKAAALSELVRKAKAPPNGQLAALGKRIHVFEERYEITSAQMRQRVEKGQMHDTADVATWLILLNAREHASR